VGGKTFLEETDVCAAAIIPDAVCLEFSEAITLLDKITFNFQQFTFLNLN
ncbi:hypothetical protein X975_19449, partial [Stegodyphus mimosarum]